MIERACMVGWELVLRCREVCRRENRKAMCCRSCRSRIGPGSADDAITGFLGLNIPVCDIAMNGKRLWDQKVGQLPMGLKALTALGQMSQHYSWTLVSCPNLLSQRPASSVARIYDASPYAL